MSANVSKSCWCRSVACLGGARHRGRSGRAEVRTRALRALVRTGAPFGVTLAVFRLEPRPNPYHYAVVISAARRAGRWIRALRLFAELGGGGADPAAVRAQFPRVTDGDV